MSSKRTAHIDPKGEQIAETILLPGDPLRARFIAENYLDNPRCFNEVRGMYGYTGSRNGKMVSVMGTGMGIPSISNLIRVGRCGALQEGIDLYDVVIAQGASTDSNYLAQFGVPGTYAPLSSYRLLEKAKSAADQRGQRNHVGNVLSSDIFYNEDPGALGRWARMGILAVEMESAGLFANAAAAGVDALGIFTVSDNIPADTHTTPEERETAFTAMIEIALELA
jgi:purine-nucleoside phosphorylase